MESCIVQQISLLRIPGQVLDNFDGDTMFECLWSNGATSVLDLDKEQKAAIESMVTSGEVKLGETQLDISKSIFSGGDKVSLPNGKVRIKSTRSVLGRNLATTTDRTSGTKRFLAVKVRD
eukprot:2969377-Ditylum_brightwellii.AAC.1